jgi:XTP/dITP diphosphohydrolase
VELRFLSRNEFKLQEAARILEPHGITVVPFLQEIEELQTFDTERLVRDKVIKAFQIVGRPVFVEHTGLCLDALNGFPDGLTQPFWDKLGADRFCELFGGENSGILAKTIIGFVDGRQYRSFSGEVRGRIAQRPRGPRDFQWDCVFVPEGYEKTFAELGPEVKNMISMRFEALTEFARFLRGREAR